MKTMMMPASYNVMNEEEMTYTTGGATWMQAIVNLVMPTYGVYHMTSDAIAEKNSNPDGWLGRLVDKHITAAKQDTPSLVYEAVTGFWSVSSILGILACVYF